MLYNKQGRVGIVGQSGVVGYSVRNRRVWHADEESGDSKQAESSGGDTKSPEEIKDPVAYAQALEKRLQEREADLHRWKEQADSYSKRLEAIEKAQRERLEKSGNFEEIAKQHAAELEALKPVAERAKALEAVIRESNKAQIERIPETLRGIVPTDYSPEKLQDWLNRSLPTLIKPPAPSYDAGAGGNSSGTASPTLTAEERAAAKRHGMTEQQYIEAKKHVIVNED